MRKVSNSNTRSCRTQVIAFGVMLSMALLLASGTTWAQKVTAAITGKVTDSSGAAIAGAKVTATDLERGTVQTTVTNSDGDYNLPQVPVGVYTVKVENAGFQTSQQSNLTLVLNQVARIDFQLQVGNVTTAVEVNSAVPLLQTESTDIGQIIDARTNTALPLATRNYVQLTLLAAGTVHPDTSLFTSAQTPANAGRPYVNGNREQENNFMLDGMDNNQVSDNLVGYAPSVDAIQEFNEITSNAPAEFGNYMGGIVNTSIKSGTNQFHGDAFEFFRNNVLNANQWSNNFTGAPRAALRWNEFGGVLGGPIKKDKIFFFVDYQGQRFDNPNTTSAISLLTAQERAGNFSAFLQQANPIQLYNPFSLNANGQRVPFAGNIIPSSLLSPMALSIVNSQYYPVPGTNTLNNNYFQTTNSAIDGNQGDAKVDWNIDDKDRLFVRYSQAYINNPGTNSIPLFYNSFAIFPQYNGVIDWTRTISPSLVNDARAGVNYVTVNNGAAEGTAVNFPQTIGFPGATSSILPAMNMTGGYLGNYPIGNGDSYQLFADTVIQYGDTVTWNKGAHNIKFGFQGWRDRIDTFYAGNNGLSGNMGFNGQYTAGPCYIGSSGCSGAQANGVGEADFMLGLPYTIGVGTNGGTWGQRANIFAAFVQDDWRVRSNLTLNLGLRWELHTPWVEVYNRQSNFGLISGQIELAGQDGNSRALYNQYNGGFNFQPRVGFAYTPGGGKTVIRGSFSMSSYLEGTGTNLRLPINPPFEGEKNATYGSDALPLTTLDQGFAPIGSATNPYAGALLRVWDPNVRPAVSEQWNFTVQRQFGNTVTFQAAYVGQKNTHLMVPMPYQQLELLPNGTTQESPYLSGNPVLKNEISQISGTASNGNQTYNALQAVLQKRLSDGLQFNVAYTYSKCMTDSSGYYGSWGGQTTPTSPYWQNLFNQKAEWGPCYYDATQILTAYATYDIPFGRSRKYGKDMNKIVNAFVGDWQINGILSLHTGFPLTLEANDASGTNSRGPRPDCISPVQYTNYQNSPQGGYQWFSQAGFTQPTAGTFGSCGVGTVRGPGLKTFDFSVDKFFAITERQSLEFRSEFINLTNTPILNSPGIGLGSSLGLLQSSSGARNIQFALKYIF
jgi:hypothetical protein